MLQWTDGEAGFLSLVLDGTKITVLLVMFVGKDKIVSEGLTTLCNLGHVS